MNTRQTDPTGTDVRQTDPTGTDVRQADPTGTDVRQADPTGTDVRQTLQEQTSDRPYKNRRQAFLRMKWRRDPTPVTARHTMDVRLGVQTRRRL